MLERILEPEVMDTPEEARDYNDMDHQEVNQLFVEDLLAFAKTHELSLGDVLDPGTGTALIPIELCRHDTECRVMAIDMAANMLDLAKYNIEANGLTERIQLAQVDAKSMVFEDGMFDTVMSNSIVHHIPEPRSCLAEMDRVLVPGGIIFVRDLARPADMETLESQVQMYTGNENAHSQQMFRESLHAALSLEEIQSLVFEYGYEKETVKMTSDRHWTWAAIKPIYET